jgi:hypothetical protein
LLGLELGLLVDEGALPVLVVDRLLLLLLWLWLVLLRHDDMLALGLLLGWERPWVVGLLLDVGRLLLWDDC